MSTSGGDEEQYLYVVLSPSDIEKLLKEAPDSQYVAIKVVPLSSGQDVMMGSLRNRASPYRYLPIEEVRPYDMTAPTNSHIVQVNATNLPYQVLVVYEGYYCSGSLVSSRVVVTAASCLHKYHYNEKLYVKVGSDTIIDAGPTLPPIYPNFSEVITVSDVKIHEFFQHTSIVDNDIAMLILQKNVDFGTQFRVAKIALIDPDTALRVGTGISVSGFGSTKLKPEYVNKLLISTMVVMARQQCEDTYGGIITNSNFCAAYDPVQTIKLVNQEGRLSDNGGPATHGQVLVGILSFGAFRKEKPTVAVFTNVSYFHKWIVMNTKRYLKKYCVITSTSSYNTSYEYDTDVSDVTDIGEEDLPFFN